MKGSVERDVLQAEPDDPVERSDGFALEGFEHTGCDPLIAPRSQGGVGDPVLEDRFDVDPGGAGHEPDEDPPEAQSVGHSWAVTAQRM